MNIENEFIQIQYEVGSDPQLEEDIKSGDVIIGRLEVFKAWANGLCFVKCSGIKENIVINNANDRGPALQGDIVAVRMTRYEDKQGEVAVDDFDIEEKTPMSKVLADGRRIQNVKLTTDDKTVERKLSQDVRLRNAIGAPPYEQVQFPEGKSPTEPWCVCSGDGLTHTRLGVSPTAS
ncbi:hypothetical protein ADEAN_000651900 [Angomonas deanei]|uniref:Uncharacterized protein n=1 Tax=Angomonas deanei TaxID=59799 RepID=A0A7G2CGZ4_9TRYP|nr:hypothetical protein ADEAN_000651900 [Angomonas deanei]